MVWDFANNTYKKGEIMALYRLSYFNSTAITEYVTVKIYSAISLFKIKRS